MMKVRHLLCLLGGLLAAGCVHHTLTNLTLQDHSVKRDPTGLYPIEMEWTSNQRAVMHDTIRAEVLVGATNVYPMRLQNPTLLTNRWQARVPVDANATELRYRIKVTWQYQARPVPQADSRMSREFILRIKD